jgi:hypothetical protein
VETGLGAAKFVFNPIAGHLAYVPAWLALLRVR